MADRQPSHPPSDPQLYSASSAKPKEAGIPGVADRPVRIQLFVALLVGLVLVATSLYLWRRPSSHEGAASADDTAGDAQAPMAAASDSAGNAVSAAPPVTAASPADAGSPNGVALSDPRVVGCKDHGKKMSPEDCDHPEQLEQAIAHAIEEASSCIPTSAGGGTIEYQADVSFVKKKSPISVSVARKNGSMKNAKALSACGKAVKHAVQDLSVEGMDHEHSRYTIAITATYPGPLRNR